jgi:hypothetical protein
VISRLTRLQSKQDQIVLFTLVELMTHLVFLAIILGLAVGKAAETRADELVAKCGADGRRCIVVAEAEQHPSGAGAEDGVARGVMLPSCAGETRPFVELRALADGRYQILPLAAPDPRIAAHPAVEPLLRARTLTWEELDRIGVRIREAANSGVFGPRCNLTVRLCRAHANAGLWDLQRSRTWYHFQVVGLSACR